MKELKDRWKTPEGVKKIAVIFDAFSKSIPLDKMEFIQKHEGRFDLRGITAPYAEAWEAKKINFNIYIDIVKISGYNFSDIDFSFSDLTIVDFKNCVFYNAIFKSSKLFHISFISCDFKNCVFEKCNLMGTSMGQDFMSNNKMTSYTDVNFIKCDMRKTSYRAPIFKNTLFNNCNLKKINFSGSRFFDCKFIGKLDSVEFGGYIEYFGNSKMDIEKGIKEGEINPMQNVDFTESNILGIGFRRQCDVSTCKFPVSDDYLLIPNKLEKLKKTIPLIKKEFEGKEQEFYLEMFSKTVTNWFNEEKNSHTFIDKFIYKNYCSPESVDKYFSILREVIALPDEPEQDEKPKGVWDKVQNFLKGKEN